MTIPGTIRGGLIVVAMLCAFGADMVAQVNPYPYLSAPSLERGVRLMIDAGMLRRAAARLTAIADARKHSSINDVIPFDVAEIRRQSGNRAGADREIDDFLRHRSRSPFVPAAWMERGLAALEDHDLESAAGFLARCAAEAKSNSLERRDSTYIVLAHEALFWEGSSRAGIGQYKEALDVYNACIETQPNGMYAAWSTYAIGQLYERNHDLPQAIASFGIVRNRYADSRIAIAARIREGVNYLILRQPERALDVLTNIDEVIDDADSAEDSHRPIDAEYAREEVALIRAEAFSQRGRFSDAYDSCVRFLTKYPTSFYRWDVHLRAGYSALNLGRADTARKHYAAILDSVTDEASVVRQQAVLYHALSLKRSGQTDEAVRAFAALATQTGYPYQAQALVEVGQAWYEAGDYDKARISFEKAERESRDAQTSLRAHVLLGASLVELQQWAKAAQAYERAQSIAEEASEEFVPDRQAYLSEVRLKRGICLVQSGQTQKAINALTDFLGNHSSDLRRDEATFWLAESMYRADLLKNAQELYEEVVKRFTGSIRREEAMYGLAWTFFRRRDFDRSTSMFGELLRTFPQSVYTAEALSRRGDGLYILRQFHAASLQYEEAARKAPNSEEGQYSSFQAGQASYRAGDFDVATISMRRFVQKYPKSKLADDAMYLIGWVSFQQRNDAKAIEEFQRLLTVYPDGDHAVRALFTIGDAQFNLGDVDASMATYRGVISRFPSHPLASEAAKAMQVMLLGMGRTQEALDIADTLINANPQSLAAAEFSFKKAEILYSGKNYTSAAAELEAYMKKYPSSQQKDEALYLLGKTYLTMNELGQARASFVEIEKKYAHSPFIVISKLDLAEYYARSANGGSADSLYEIVWTRFPEDSDAASKAGYERALIARGRGDSARALEMFRSTADRYSRTEYGDQSRYNTATLYRRAGITDSAIYHLRLLTNRSDKPQFASNALYDLGTIYLRAKRYEEAAAQYELVRQEYAGYEDWYTLSLLALGECYEILVRSKEARDVYEVISRLRPDDDFGKTAVARIKRLKKMRP